jgi:hypothetical protein
MEVLLLRSEGHFRAKYSYGLGGDTAASSFLVP